MNATANNAIQLLITLNECRARNYERAADLLTNVFHVRIKTLFFQLAEESRRYARELADFALTTDASVPQVEQHFWPTLDTASELTATDALTCCVCGEEETLLQYKRLLHFHAMPDARNKLVRKQLVDISLSRQQLIRCNQSFGASVAYA